MVKCAVCGSENEPQAMFCGTCGSPMPQAAAPKPEPEVVVPEPEPAVPDGTVIPGKGDARRDLGIDTGTVVTPPPPGGNDEITDADTTPGAATITCSVCGTVNDADRTYCRKCANELKPPAPPPPPPPPPPSVRKLSPLALGLGAAAVVVAVALIGVLAFGGPAASPSPTHGPTAAVPTTAVTPTAEPTIVVTAPPSSPHTFNIDEGNPSGTIAFQRCPSDGSGCVIYTGKADKSSKPARVIGATSGSATSPAISHDRKRIMYSVSGGLNMVTISTRSFSKHSTGPGDTDVVWSPNDKQVAFAGHRDRDTGSGKTDLELRLDGATTGTSQALTSNDVPDLEPCFFPDGKSIIWIQGAGKDAEIWQIDIATKNPTRLTDDQNEDHEPTVSPDSKYIAFVSDRGGDGFQLYLMDLSSASHEIFKLDTGKTNVRHPSWSPKGRYLVFSAGDAGNEDLFIYDLNEQKTTTFSSGSNADLNPSWE